MTDLHKKKQSIIGSLLIISIMIASTTSWHLIDLVGMNTFWAIFFGLSFIVFLGVFSSFKEFLGFMSNFFKKKFNWVIFLYLCWISFTYVANYTGKSTILYIFKVWYLVIIYLGAVQYYFEKLGHEEEKDFVSKFTKTIFNFGILLSVLGTLQFTLDTNTFFGLRVSNWPPYNPASMYGNVNGFGTYLFFSIAAGLYCFAVNAEKNIKHYYVAGIIFQVYVLYLTVARTSIVVTSVFFIFTFAIYGSHRKKLSKLIDKKTVLTIILANIIMLSIINISYIKGYFYKNQGNDVAISRKASDMLAEKNSKGFNNRQFIWRAVIKDYDEYIIKGDGLKYNIINKINVEEVISKKSKGVDRISYHNTLFRYFASSGLLGLILFIALYAYGPLSLLISTLKRKQNIIRNSILIIFLGCIFLYMQMEEVYIGEIGFTQLITVVTLAYCNSLLVKQEK